MAHVEKYIGDSLLLGTPDKKLGFKIKDGSITLKKLATEVLSLILNHSGEGGGTGVTLIDIAERMTEENNTITDMEIKTSLFLYDVYNRVSAIARVVEPESNIPYALFKVSYYDNVEDKDKITYFAYTTEDDMQEGATWHFSKAIEADDSLYPWAMNVFGDALVDVENDLLILGNNKYQLERYAGQTVISYDFEAPVITKFEYTKVSANGGVVYPNLKFSQNITRTTTNSAGSTDETLVLTGTFNGNGFDYNDYEYATLKGSGAVPSFTGNNPYMSGGIDTVGKVELAPSDNVNETTRRTVVATVTVNEELSAEKSFGVKQYGASIGAAQTIDVAASGVKNQIISFDKTYGVIVGPDDIYTKDGWINIIAKTIEDGKVSIKYTIAANTTTVSREGVIYVNSSVNKANTSVTFRQSAATAQISVSNSNITFTNKTVGETYSSTITVRGYYLSEDITVAFKNANGDFSTSAALISKDTAMSAKGASLTIYYKPTVAGSSSNVIMLSSGNSRATVDVSGTASVAAKPAIIVKSLSLDFGDVAPGSTADLTLNVKGSNLNGAITLELPEKEVRYSLDKWIISAADASSAAGGTVTVTFAPTGIITNEQNSTITLKTEGGNDVTVALIGRCVAGNITVDKESISFEETEVKSYNESLTVTGTNLNAAITLEITGSGSSRFSLSQSSISAADARNGKEITITYSPVDTAVESKATLTLTSGSTMKQVSLRGIVTIPEEESLGYYGAGNALPTSLDDAYGTFEVADGKEISIDYTQVTGTYVWIALPSEVNVTVICYDGDGDKFPVKSNSSSIDEYTVYYIKGWTDFMENHTFKITYKATN